MQVEDSSCNGLVALLAPEALRVVGLVQSLHSILRVVCGGLWMVVCGKFCGIILCNVRMCDVIKG